NCPSEPKLATSKCNFTPVRTYLPATTRNPFRQRSTSIVRADFLERIPTEWVQRDNSEGRNQQFHPASPRNSANLGQLHPSKRAGNAPEVAIRHAKEQFIVVAA